MTDKPYKRSLFLFRRDLRLEDNTALLEACAQSEEVIAAFVFDPVQVGNNPYKGEHAIQFMIESLEDVDNCLRARGARLYCFHESTIDVLSALFEKVDAIFLNHDYTPFSRKRDKRIKSLAEEMGTDFHAFHDLLLITPTDALKADGTPYLVYTPFFKNAIKQEVREPKRNTFKNFYSGKLSGSVALDKIDILEQRNENLYVNGGREEGLKLLNAAKELSGYEDRRNTPSDEQGTTKLSPHHKFGTLSIREVYHGIASSHGPEHSLIRELYWRDFFSHIAVHYPHVFGKTFYPHFDDINWENDKKKFKKWCEGKTGFPIVDAGMRQLNETGYMHNRVRMVVASFLTKDLHIDWRWGEKYFATKLVDYDPAVNNGNWQWAASTGCDAQPYFRIFNPWLQQKKFDPECKYVKKWVPELKDLDPKQIHKLGEQRDMFAARYPEPVVEHSEAKSIAEDLYGDVVGARKSPPSPAAL